MPIKSRRCPWFKILLDLLSRHQSQTLLRIQPTQKKKDQVKMSMSPAKHCPVINHFSVHHAQRVPNGTTS